MGHPGTPSPGRVFPRLGDVPAVTILPAKTHLPSLQGALAPPPTANRPCAQGAAHLPHPRTPEIPAVPVRAGGVELICDGPPS